MPTYTDPEEAAGVPFGNAATFAARVQAYAQKWGHPPPDSHGGILKGLDPVGEGLSKIVDKGAASLGLTDPRTVDPANATADRARSVDLYTKLLQERGNTPTYTPQQVNPQSVTAVTTGPIERVSAGSVAAPQDVTLSPTARGVTAQQVAGPGAATAFTVGPAQILDSQGQQVRGQQISYLDALKQRSMGQGPSVAEEQQKRALDNITATQTGLAAQAHGNQGVFARREAMRNISDAQQKTALDKSLLRATEITQATGQLGGALEGVRATDTGTAVHQADLVQGANLNNSQLTTQTNQFNKSMQARIDEGNAARTLAADTTTATQGNQRDVDVAAVQGANANRGVAVATGNADRNLTATTTNAAAYNADETANANRLTGTAAGNADRSLTGQTTNVTSGLQANAQRINEAAGKTSAVLQANGQAMGGTATVDAVKAANNAAADKSDAAFAGAASTGLALYTGGAPGVAAKALTKSKPDEPIDYSGGTYRPEDTGGAVSDKRTKKDIKADSTKDVDAFLAALKPYAYQYKNPTNGTGERHGVMAQDLEKSKIGRSVVRTDPAGIKHVDTDALVLAMAGVLAKVAKDTRRTRKAA